MCNASRLEKLIPEVMKQISKRYFGPTAKLCGSKQHDLEDFYLRKVYNIGFIVWKSRSFEYDCNMWALNLWTSNKQTIMYVCKLFQLRHGFAHAFMYGALVINFRLVSLTVQHRVKERFTKSRMLRGISLKSGVK